MTSQTAKEIYSRSPIIPLIGLALLVVAIAMLFLDIEYTAYEYKGRDFKRSVIGFTPYWLAYPISISLMLSPVFGKLKYFSTNAETLSFKYFRSPFSYEFKYTEISYITHTKNQLILHFPKTTELITINLPGLQGIPDELQNIQHLIKTSDA